MVVTVLFSMVLIVVTDQELLLVVQGMSMGMVLMTLLLGQDMATPMGRFVQERVM